MPNYWVISWNANREEGEKLSTRIFNTFLDKENPFETYGYSYSNSTIELFNEVKKGDVIFCYQTDEGKYVGLCQVEKKTSEAPGGRCLVLAKVKAPQPDGHGPKQKGWFHRLNEDKAKSLCIDLGLPWPLIISN
jgi:hypothetical protein